MDQPTPNVSWEALLQDLAQLYHEVDEAARRLEAVHADRLQCRRGCSSCCVDNLTVFEVEAETIRRHHEDLLSVEKPHADGACAFLGETGACRIYEDRPYVCRTQGLPLRWIAQGPKEAMVEYRDICLLNEEGEPVDALSADVCWTIGPFEARLAQLQARRDGGELRRISLRTLFHDHDA